MLIRFDSLTHNNKIIAVLLAWKQSTVCAQRDLDIVRREKHKQILRESFTRSFTLSLLMKISMIFSVHWKQLHTVNLALHLMPFKMVSKVMLYFWHFLIVYCSHYLNVTEVCRRREECCRNWFAPHQKWPCPFYDL